MTAGTRLVLGGVTIGVAAALAGLGVRPVGDSRRPEITVAVASPEPGPATATEPPLAVPAQAVVVRVGAGLFVVDGDVARFVRVELGVRTGAQVEVTGGLDPGAAVVVGPAAVLSRLKDGDRVRRR